MYGIRLDIRDLQYIRYPAFGLAGYPAKNSIRCIPSINGFFKIILRNGNFSSAFTLVLK
jgi:hypothetical protein